MSFSETSIQRLARIEPYYKYDAGMGDKWLTSVIAPSQTGKSTLIADAVALAPSLGFSDPDNMVTEVNTITTRDRRRDDPKGYRTAREGITPAWMMGRVRQKELVQWSYFDTGHMYATDRQSYPGKYNLLPTQEKALRMLGKAGFRHLSIVCVVRPVDEWRACFPETITTENHVGRLKEAIRSLDFGMEQQGIIRIVNYSDPERRRRTAESLVRIATSGVDGYSSDMLDPYHEQEYDQHNWEMRQAAQQMLDEAVIAA